MWEMTKGNRVAGQILNILKKVYAFQLGIMENRHKRKCGKTKLFAKLVFVWTRFDTGLLPTKFGEKLRNIFF